RLRACSAVEIEVARRFLLEPQPVVVRRLLQELRRFLEYVVRFVLRAAGRLLLLGGTLRRRSLFLGVGRRWGGGLSRARRRFRRRRLLDRRLRGRRRSGRGLLFHK